MAETPECPTFDAAFTGLPDSGEWRTHPSIGDINGDGLGDLVALNRKGKGPRAFLGNGLGGWSEASSGLEYPRGTSCGIGTKLVDLDADGFLDLVVADHCQGVIVYRGDGGTSWENRSKGIPRNLEGFNDADVADINNDGLLDIIALSAYERGFLVLIAQPDGSWFYKRDSGLPDTGAGFEVQLLDVNGDGRVDVVSNFSPSAINRSDPPPPAKVWNMTDWATFVPGKGFENKARFMGLSTWSQPDGAIDIFFALVGAQGGIHLYRPRSGGRWVEIKRINDDWYAPDAIRKFVDVEVADFNGDGCPDIVATEAWEQQVVMAVGDCKDNWHLCSSDTFAMDVKMGGWGLATGDFNGDGRTDVAGGFGSEQQGGLKAWIQKSPSAGVAGSHGQMAPVTRSSLGLGEPVPAP